MKTIASALVHLRGFLRDVRLLHNHRLLTIEKYNFNLGRFLLFGLSYPRVFGSILVLGGKEGTIEVSDRCNLECEGCHYFEDDGYTTREERNLRQYERFLDSIQHEFRTVHLGGAEPSLEQDRLRLITQRVKNSVVYTNGIIKISPDIACKIHISVWGLDDKGARGAAALDRVIRNYAGDRRAVFIITINRANLDEIEPLVDELVRHGFPISFNHYSPTQKLTRALSTGARTERIRFSNATDNLTLTPAHLERSKRIIERLLERYPQNILYTAEMNEWIHKPEGVVDYDERGEAYCCTNRSGRPGITYRAFTADLQEKPGKCCFSDMPCEVCRLYAVAWPNFLMQFTHHIGSRQQMRAYAANLSTYERLCRLLAPG